MPLISNGKNNHYWLSSIQIHEAKILNWIIGFALASCSYGYEENLQTNNHT